MADYLCDMVYHGFVQLGFHIDLLTRDGDYRWMFIGQSTKEQRWKQWGHAFTVSNLVQCQKKHLITQQNAKKNILQKKYDFVVYGSIQRCDLLQQFVVDNYPKNKIVYINGEDWIWSNWQIDKNIRDRILNRSKKGLYFKRQMDDFLSEYCIPISFAIPQCKICNIDKLDKKLYQATIIPGKKQTYIYTEQQPYYQGYRDSYFGITCAKAGFDCLRHYEIMANGCIPYFIDIEKIPKYCMVNFPKNMIIYTNKLFQEKSQNKEQLLYYCNWYLNYTKNYLTTKQLAKYICSKVCF